VEKQSRNIPKKDDEILHVISATESTSRLSSSSAGLTFSNAAQHSAAPFLDFITKRKIMGKKKGVLIECKAIVINTAAITCRSAP